MGEDNKIKSIVEDFFQNATPEEIQEFNALIEERKKRKSIFGSMDINGVASGFAERIKEQVGFTTENVSKMARGIVREMIYQYDQNISEEEVEILLDQWVPNQTKNNEIRIPGDALAAMVSQFVAYGSGELTEEQLKAFPEGWTEKYWAAFPVDLQKLIRGYLKDQISKKEFWTSVKALLEQKL